MKGCNRDLKREKSEKDFNSKKENGKDFRMKWVHWFWKNHTILVKTENSERNIVYFWLGRKVKYGIVFFFCLFLTWKRKVKYIFWFVLNMTWKTAKPKQWQTEEIRSDEVANRDPGADISFLGKFQTWRMDCVICMTWRVGKVTERAAHWRKRVH